MDSWENDYRNRPNKKYRKTRVYTLDELTHVRKLIEDYYATYHPTITLNSNEANFAYLFEDLIDSSNSIEIKEAGYICDIYNNLDKTSRKNIQKMNTLIHFLNSRLNKSDSSESSPPAPIINTGNINTHDLPFLTTFDNEEHSIKTLFRTKYIPLFGREYEIKLLNEFWDSPSSFSWWLILGAAGSGKSKLALMFCLSLKSKGIYAGFLDHMGLKSFDWYNWTPNKDTFIVIDYAGTYYSDIVEIIDIVSKRQLLHKVRFLLIERNNIGEWWESLQVKIRLEYVTIWRVPIWLKPLTKESAVQIFKAIAEKGDSGVCNEHDLFEQFTLFDSQRRPLFAILTALVLSNNTNVVAKTKVDLFQIYYDRERMICENCCSQNKISPDLLHKHVNLCLLSTVVRGISISNSKALFDSHFEWLPKIDELSDDLYQLICSKQPSEHNYYEFIEPDIFGEYFVIHYLHIEQSNRLLKRKRITEIIETVWAMSPFEVHIFIGRALQDFPELHEKIEVFIDCSVGNLSSTQKLQLSKSIIVYIDFCIKHSYLDKAVHWYNCLCEYNSAAINTEFTENISEAAFYLCRHYINVNNEVEFERYYKDIKEIVNRNGSSATLYHLIEAIFLLIEHYRIQNDSKMIKFYNSEFLQLDDDGLVNSVFIYLSYIT